MISREGQRNAEGLPLVTSQPHRTKATRNWMGQVGWGSFAYVGRQTTPYCQPIEEHVYLSVEVGEACQLSCRHCIYHRQRAETPFPNELVGHRVREALERGLDPLWVSFAGKEPTLFPDRLLEWARVTRRPNRLNILMTNGLRLCGDRLTQFSDVFDYFDISLDGDEEAHDWMRGPGTFRKTWKNIEGALAQTEADIGIIATAVHSDVNDGHEQISDLTRLAQKLQSTFGSENRISLTISLYYDQPNAAMLLGADDIARLMEGIGETGFPARVLFTANYAHSWPRVASLLGWQHVPLLYDLPTAYPLVRQGSLSVILFNLTDTYQLGLRVSNEGYVYLGCNHLVLGDKAPLFKVGDLANEGLDEIAARVTHGEAPLMETLEDTPRGCLACANWEVCRGGDRLSGLYFGGQASDPYCEILAAQGGRECNALVGSC